MSSSRNAAHVRPAHLFEHSAGGGGDGDGDGGGDEGGGGDGDGDGEERDSRHGAASSRTRRASYTCSLDPITGASITFREPFTVRSTKV